MSTDAQGGGLPRGLLVAFEGIDGAGKTTQAKLFSERLRQAGLVVTQAKEPTDGWFGRALRESAATGRLPPQEELNLFVEDRKMHVTDVINPALARVEVVVMDRYYFSNAAYQGARGLDVDAVLARNEAFAPQPDLLVFLDISVEEAVARIDRRDGQGNLFEQADDLARCAAIFRQITRPYLLHLDGQKPVDELHALIVEAFDRGPLFRALCHKPHLPSCEPECCEYRLQHLCKYPSLGSLRPKPLLSAAHVNSIATDESLSPEERLDRMREMLRFVR